MRKPSGSCPFCQAEMIPNVEVENVVRRDKCRCSNCNAEIFLCRMPGCHNYTKGGIIYDDELCYTCTNELGTGAKNAVSIVTQAFAAAAAAAIVASIFNKDGGSK